MKKFFAVLLVLLLVPGTVAFASTPQAVIDARESVVRVVAMEFADDSVEQLGSGFVVAQGPGGTYVATNRSVVVANHGRRLFEELAERVQIVLTDLSGPMLNAEVVFVTNELDSTMDLVLLRVPSGLRERPVLPLAEPAAVEIGMEVFALGFPMLADEHDEGWLVPSRLEDVFLTSGRVTSEMIQLDGRNYLRHDAIIAGGNAGGPLLDSSGAVVGINTGTLADGQGALLGDAKHTGYLIDAAAEMAIPIVLAGASSIPLVPIAIGLAVVAVAAVVIFLVARGKPAPAPAAPAGFPSPPPAMPKPSSAPAKLTGVRGTGGQYNTVSFPVTDRAAFGRDVAKCAIVFEAKTMGVSSLHCEITRVGEGLQITDRGSSYGTFLKGKKMSVNTPVNLAPGDTFYLGNERNSFVAY